jgi:glucokinase
MLHKEEKYVRNVPKGKEFLLGVDIGGTNSNFGVFKDKKLLLALHYKSKEVKNFTWLFSQVTTHVKEKYGISIQAAGIAGPGIVRKRGTHLTTTNLSWGIDTKKLREKFPLRKVKLMNDYAAIAYGIDLLPKKSVVQVKKGIPLKTGTRIVLGAGTGLGKEIIRYDDHIKKYVPLSSEGGHGDLAVVNQEELQLADFVRKKTKKQVVEWEDVLSGPGSVNIFQFVESYENLPVTQHVKDIRAKKYDPKMITICGDAMCGRTFEFFSRFYARCAKNFALDALALGGVYIAGGIAAKHVQMFKAKAFRDEFINSKKMKKTLQQIPVYVIADYNVSLYGAVEAVR